MPIETFNTFRIGKNMVLNYLHGVKGKRYGDEKCVLKNWDFLGPDLKLS